MVATEKAFNKQQLALIADDFRLLARFHDREFNATFLDGLRKGKITDFLSVSIASDAAVKAAGDLDEALALLPSAPGQAVLDALAVEYANIYLCHNYRIAPTGSVWLTEESLERQEPMFVARGWYAKYDMGAPDWRVRPDDHIVHELQFLARLCELGTKQSMADAVAFLDQCVLVWVPDFANAVSERAHEAIYIASAALTAAYLEELRDVLEVITGVARPVKEPESNENTIRLYDIDQDRPFVPGVSESW